MELKIGSNRTPKSFQNQFPNTFDNKQHETLIFVGTPMQFAHFCCPEGIKVYEKSFENHIKVHDEINIDQRYQNIPKMLPKSSPKPSKMVGVKQRASKTISEHNMTPKWSKNPPKGLPKKWIFCGRKKSLRTNLPEGPRDSLGHWRVCFGHGEDDGKGFEA